MNTLNKIIVGLGVLLMVSSPLAASGKDAPGFHSLFGNWYTDKDGQDQVYIEDGGKWVQGTPSPTAHESIHALYGEHAHTFLKGISAYNVFPLSLFQDIKDFQRGTITVLFKAISGKEDQAAGIAFNIRESGEYLVVRANALENNLILFSFSNGQRSHVLDIDNVPTAARQWHKLTIVIQGNKVEGYLDEKKYLEYSLKENVSGRVGLWSKSDSYVLFKLFTVQAK